MKILILVFSVIALINVDKCKSKSIQIKGETVAELATEPARKVAYYINSDDHWEFYKEKYNKNYTKDEEVIRRKNWENNIEIVNKHNKEYVEGLHTWTQGINQFSDGTKPGKGLLIKDEEKQNKRLKIGVLMTNFTSTSKPSNSTMNRTVEVYYADTEEDWKNYKTKFNKVYENPEKEKDARSNWKKNVKQVNRHNKEYVEGLHTWTQGVNQFSDGTNPFMGLRPIGVLMTNFTTTSKPSNSTMNRTVEVYYADTEEDWKNYKTKFNKVYENPEKEKDARSNWKINVKQVNRHNKEYVEGLHTWTQGVNQFSDGTNPFNGELSLIQHSISKSIEVEDTVLDHYQDKDHESDDEHYDVVKYDDSEEFFDMEDYDVEYNYSNENDDSKEYDFSEEN